MASEIERRLIRLCDTFDDARTQIEELVPLVTDERQRFLDRDPSGEAWRSLCARWKPHIDRLPRDTRVDLARALDAAGLPQRAIAATLGRSQDTVRRDLQVNDDRSPDPDRRKVGDDGKNYPASRPPTDLMPRTRMPSAKVVIHVVASMQGVAHTVREFDWSRVESIDGVDDLLRDLVEARKEINRFIDQLRSYA